MLWWTLLLAGCAGNGPKVCPRPQDVRQPEWADANADGVVDLVDGLRITRHSLAGGPGVACRGQGDLLGSGDVALESANHLWNYLFVGQSTELPALKDCTLRQDAPAPTCASGVVLDFDAPSRVDAQGGKASFEATVRLEASDIAPEAWSFGVGAEGCAIVGVTRAGTQADSTFHGGRFEAGFAREQLVRGGVVAGTVLSWREVAALDPDEPHDVLVLEVEAKAPSGGCEPCTLSFRDDLKGDGQKVAVVVGAGTHAYEPTRRDAVVKVCAP